MSEINLQTISEVIDDICKLINTNMVKETIYSFVVYMPTSNEELRQLINRDKLQYIDTRHMTDMSNLGLRETTYLKYWNMSNVVNVSGMFTRYIEDNNEDEFILSLDYLIDNYWNIGKVRNMHKLVSVCKRVTSSFDMSIVCDMSISSMINDYSNSYNANELFGITSTGSNYMSIVGDPSINSFF